MRWTHLQPQSLRRYSQITEGRLTTWIPVSGKRWQAATRWLAIRLNAGVAQFVTRYHRCPQYGKITSRRAVTLPALTVPPGGLETDSYADLSNNNLRSDASDASPRWTTRVLLSHPKSYRCSGNA